MHRKDAIAWVVCVCASCLRLSQAKTLAILVASALHVERISLASIGRAMKGAAAKHQIKRCWRFVDNDRVEPTEAMKGVLQRVMKKRKKKLLISLDWTKIRDFQMLMASAVIRGRSVPLLWSSTQDWKFDKSRNAFEEGLLLLLRSMIPEQVSVTILADRGFGRTELARFCQRYGFHYLIRICPDVHVKGESYSGKLLDYPVFKGIRRVLKQVLYRSGKNPVRQNVVVYWRRGLPRKRDECWFLMSDLDASAPALCQLYGRRMTIEELFRDSKSKRNGWSLRDIGLKTPQRLDRLMLILALAYWLLCGIGLMARSHSKPSSWCSNSKAETCSVFLIGRIMLDRIKLSPAQAFTAVCDALEKEATKWG